MEELLVRRRSKWINVIKKLILLCMDGVYGKGEKISINVKPTDKTNRLEG
jgi:hypothetical protein